LKFIFGLKGLVVVDTYTKRAPTLFHAINLGEALDHQQSKIFTPIFDPLEHDLFLEQLFMDLFLEQLF
jgi:hypothetical protein